MHINEVKEAKRILENEIAEMLDLFERDTGVRIKDVTMYGVDVTRLGDAGARSIKNVNVEVTL